MAEKAMPLLIELLPGCHRFVYEDGETLYWVDADEGTCTCPDWFYRARHKRQDCRHLAGVRRLLTRRKELQKAAPINVERMEKRVQAA